MTIQHALLTSLLEKPSTGYQLANRFDRSIGYFWQATHQQIYRELKRMAAARWVEAEEEGEPGGRKRKTYHVLPAGREELVRWVSQPDSSGPCTSALLVKLRAEAILGPMGVLQEMNRLWAYHEERLATYRQIEQRDFTGDQLSDAQQLQHRVLKMGIMKEENWLAWARDTLALLDTISEGSSTSA
ncbi:MAG: PadR family transcriptional regulator [Marinobacter sp.]|nr:PadR family transcriptional regulator [Marinobacter sp.]